MTILIAQNRFDYSKRLQTPTPWRRSLPASRLQDSFAIKFGMTQTNATRVESVDDVTEQLNSLLYSTNRYVRLSAAKPKAEESEIILKGILPQRGLYAIPGLRHLQEAYLPAEAYALTEDNPYNFFKDGDIPDTYYMTRIDNKLCREAATADALRKATIQQIVDIGSGGDEFSKGKIFLNRSRPDSKIVYVPIDLDDGMLNEASRQFLEDDNYRHVKVASFEGKFEDILPILPPKKERLYLFLGGTIGNLTTKQLNEFKNQLSASALPGSLLLVTYSRAPENGNGQKHVTDAYSDEQTRQILIWFMKQVVNPLLAIHDSIQGFDPNKWEYEVVYDKKRIVRRQFKCIEPQTIYFKKPCGAKRSFKVGDTVNLGFTKQFHPEDILNIFSDFDPVTNWTDENKYVGLMLLRKRDNTKIPLRGKAKEVIVKTRAATKVS